MRRTQMGLSAALGMLLVSVTIAWAEPSIQRLAPVSKTEVVLYSVSPAALVRQHIQVHLPEGESRLTFGWAGDNIEAASVRLSTPPGLSVGGSSKPAGTDKALAWDVAAAAEGDYQVTLMYLLGNLQRSPSYRLLCTPDRATVTLEGYLTLTNESGLALEDVEVRMILGRPGADPSEAMPATPSAFALTDLRDLPLGSKLQARFLCPMSMPAELVYRIDSESASETVQRVLVVQPPSSGSFTQEALPRGALQAMAVQPGESARRLLATELSYEPGQEFELALGPERDLVVEREMLDQRKIKVEFDRLGRVSGFDTVEQYRILVRNRRPDAAEIEVVETVLGTWDFATRARYAQEQGRVIMHLSVPAGEERLLQFSLTKHSGSRIP